MVGGVVSGMTVNDDAEEDSVGAMDINSSDLELVKESSDQTVGIRFSGVSIPQGATVLNAYVQFKVDETASGATALMIQGQAADNSPAFTTSSGDISSRGRTNASVQWNPVAWNIVGEAGTDQRTPSLVEVIQEIVNRPGWTTGSALVIIVTGSGRRTAESYDGDASGAPLLHVEYSLSGGGTPTPPEAPRALRAIP